MSKLWLSVRGSGPGTSVRSLPLFALFAASLPYGGISSPLFAQKQVESAGNSSSNGVGTQFELSYWNAVAGSNDRDQYEAYLNQYPFGTFAGLARARIASLSAKASQAALPAPGLPALPPAGAPYAAAPAYPASPISAPPFPQAAAPAQAAPDIGQLAMDMASSQTSQSYANPAAVMAFLGAPPILSPLPAVDLPERFCSADARNAFYDRTFKPAKEVADQNNRRTIGYLEAIQGLFQRYSAQNDPVAMSTLAKASTAYQPVAADAYRASNDFSAKFSNLMNVPIGGKCL